MKAVESEGSTVDQAVERALILLDLPRERVEVEVVQDSTEGRTAIVRVTPLGQQPKPVSRETPREPSQNANLSTPRERLGEDQADQVRVLISEILSHMGLSCVVGRAVVDSDGDRTTFEITGEDAGIAIGRQGQTLDAIELVVNRITDRRWPGSSPVTVDAEGYRGRRAQKLIDIALHEASEVRRSGRGVELEPMSPRDRRSIHMALQGESGVTTHSEGEGSYRHIVIEPAGSGVGGRSRIR